MSAGYFSWSRLFTHCGLKKEKKEMKSNEKLSERTRAGVPTTTQYITASGKEVLKLLQSAAGVLPVPLLQDAIKIAIKIIEVCEEVSAVEQKVKELQERVCHLMVVIVENVTAKNEEGSEEVVVKAAKAIERDIEGLLSTLKIINNELAQIGTQKRLLTAVYTNLNISTVEGCLQRLSAALEKFKLANDLRDSDLLQELHARLGKIHGITQQVAKDVKDIKQILAETQRSSNTVVRQRMPLKPHIFHGREELVEEIAQLFMNEESSRVCILGPGGMGKTSVSLAVVELSLVKERFPGGNCIWVPCIGATSESTFLEILYVHMQVPGDKQVTLDKIIFELNTSKEPRLLLLDNFETPWNAPGETQKQINDILCRLAMLSHVGIFVTMRGTYPPCDAIKWQTREIHPTNEQACRRIFHDINPSSKGDPDIGRLVAALGYMPFAVTLMANLGKRGRSTAKQLLDDWDKSGTNMLSVTNSLEKNMNRSISLSVDSDLVKQDPDAVLLLAILSMLPAGTTRQNLRWWAPTLNMITSAIATLSDAALLVEIKQQNSHSPVLFVIPVVQSFMQKHGRITDEVRHQVQLSCYKYVMNYACRFHDSTFSVNSKALTAEDTNIQSILLGSPPSQPMVSYDRTLEALIAFSWHRCDTKPSLEIANHTVKRAKASEIKRYIAPAVWCLGRTYQQLGNHQFAYYQVQEAYQLFNTHLSDDDLESQRLGGQCGIDLVDAARAALVQDSGVAVSLAREVETQCAALSDDVIHSRSLVMLGSVLDQALQRQVALQHLNRARTMLITAGNPSNLAVACQAISRVHYHERRLPEALDAIEEAWKQAELSDNTFIQAVVSLTYSMILFTANSDSEAQKHIEIALTKASHFGNRLTVARALQYMGYGNLRKGDYQNAYGAYEAAVEQYRGTVDAWGGKRCKENMARIHRKQGNPDLLVGFYRPAPDVDQSLFYPPAQVAASDVPVPGI